LARVLKGRSRKQEGFLEGPDTSLRGQWATSCSSRPGRVRPEFKTAMGDLPIVPEKFKAGRARRALAKADECRHQNSSVARRRRGRQRLRRPAGGELIFAYLYEKAKAKKSVQRLWLNSMTNAAMKEAFKELRPRRSSRKLEQAARSRSEADWIVGMNATRAATIRLRSSFRRCGLARRVQTPTLAIIARREEEIRAFTPEPYWLVDANVRRRSLKGTENGDQVAEKRRSGAGQWRAGGATR